MEDTEDIPLLLKKDYHYAALNALDLSSRLQALAVENMYVIQHSPEFKSLGSPSREYWYKTEFEAVKMSEELLGRLRNAEASQEFGHPPPNPFLSRNLKPLKPAFDVRNYQDRPFVVRELPYSRVYFHQDTDFDQPQAEVRCKISTPDLGFPRDQKGLVFALLWSSLLAES